MLNFKKVTFICLDIPEELSDKIRRIRQSLDTKIAWKPVVITLAGSSGCGHISDKQDIFEANEIISDLVKSIAPFKVKFSKINFFPKTDIYFFEFMDDLIINDIHHKVKHCGIKFFDNEYPFKAHCTIHFKGKMTKDKKSQIHDMIIPDEEFEINTLSIISDYKHLSRFQLAGHSTNNK
ncbi:MAG: hypothetical protein CMF96_09785 [Candidatus Marinimicrobia bacterium]|nr:hypothetical protein [Candidatus Neomarinimicrobiota bacterium]|tara:strand:- start:3953 stop:4489 length:537 start_codon:yes stop_codon:yes gene_type:complete